MLKGFLIVMTAGIGFCSWSIGCLNNMHDAAVVRQYANRIDAKYSHAVGRQYGKIVNAIYTMVVLFELSLLSS